MSVISERQFGPQGHLATFAARNKNAPGSYGMEHMQNGLTNVSNRKSGTSGLYKTSTGEFHAGEPQHGSPGNRSLSWQGHQRT